MANVPVQLFFKSTKKYGVGSITFDLILGESHNFSNQVTEHTIEDGSNITDHIKNELENGSLNGLVTNFSLKVNGIVSNRAQDAFDQMVLLWEKKELVTIITVLRVYTDVAITNISVQRGSDSGESVSFDVSFKKVKKVKLKSVLIEASVNISDMSSDANRQAAPTVEVGRTSPK